MVWPTSVWLVNIHGLQSRACCCCDPHVRPKKSHKVRRRSCTEGGCKDAIQHAWRLDASLWMEEILHRLRCTKHLLFTVFLQQPTMLFAIIIVIYGVFLSTICHQPTNQQICHIESEFNNRCRISSINRSLAFTSSSWMACQVR